MRITDVTTVLYEYPLRRPICDVHKPEGTRRHADLAVSGLGDVFWSWIFCLYSKRNCLAIASVLSD